MIRPLCRLSLISVQRPIESSDDDFDYSRSSTRKDDSVITRTKEDLGNLLTKQTSKFRSEIPYPDQTPNLSLRVSRSDCGSTSRRESFGDRIQNPRWSKVSEDGLRVSGSSSEKRHLP